MKRVGVFFLATCILALVPATARASLIGDSVNCSITPTPFWTCSPTSAVVGAGTEFDLLVGGTSNWFDADLDANSITLIPQIDFGLGANELLTFSDLYDPSLEIIGVSLTIVGNIIGLTSSDISFTAHSVTLNLNNTGTPAGTFSDLWNVGDSVRIDLITQRVPEPASLALLGLGLAAAGVRRARRRVL